MSNDDPLVQISPRGQLTLPAEVRKTLGIRPGDPLIVTIKDGQIVLTPAVVTPIELYTDERVREFEDAAAMSDAELTDARRKWDL